MPKKNVFTREFIKCKFRMRIKFPIVKNSDMKWTSDVLVYIYNFESNYPLHSDAIK